MATKKVTSQAHFADGVGDEVRRRLSQVAGLAVIARANSNEYRRTTKTPQQIARELGADYLELKESGRR